MKNKAEWNLYIATWPNGEVSYYVMAEEQEEADWGYLLDAEGDPSGVVVRKVEAGKMNCIAFHQSKPDGQFNPEVFGRADSVEQLLASATEVVYPSNQK
jgi:hypothetical protein